MSCEVLALDDHGLSSPFQASESIQGRATTQWKLCVVSFLGDRHNETAYVLSAVELYCYENFAMRYCTGYLMRFVQSYLFYLHNTHVHARHRMYPQPFMTHLGHLALPLRVLHWAAIVRDTM